MKKLIVVSILAVIAASCAKEALIAQQHKEIVILDRAEELTRAIYVQDFGKIWDLMMPWNRRNTFGEGTTRELYVREIGKFFSQIRMTDYDSAKLIKIGDKYAITEFEATYEFRNERGRLVRENNCERALWLKLPEGWHWQKTQLSCDYAPSAEELRYLTRNLK